MVGLRVYDGTANGMGTTRVMAVKANGEKPVWRIVLRNGQAIEATPDHLVQVRAQRRSQAEWKQVDALKPGDRLLHSTVTRVTELSSDRGNR